MKTALICGAGKGIGLALTQEVLKDKTYSTVIATHRSSTELLKLKEKFSHLEVFKYDVSKEEHLVDISKRISELSSIDLVINSIGTLQDENTKPERQILEISQESLEWAFKINTAPTLMIAKMIKNKFRASKNPIFASISAKVGSISDNKMGGWYSYRISKAALNMTIKNIAIEFKRINSNGLVVALHPGTTITDLSKPFLTNAAKKYKLHEPIDTAQNLMKVISSLKPSNDSGKLFSWTGEEILP